MNVKALKELLQNYPDDMPVVISGYEGGYKDVCGVEPRKLKRDVNEEWYYGPHESDKDGEYHLEIS